MSARVAVVVRTKDRPDFLERAVRSICGQTMSDWECVVVNDGGAPEPVEEVLSRAPRKHRDRFRIVHHERPRGRWVSANVGVLATTAPFLVLHDDDDSWHGSFLERACAYLDDPAHADRGGAVSRIEIVWEVPDDESGLYRAVGRELWQPDLTAPTLADELLYNRFVPIGFVYRRSLHEEHGLYDERLPVVGDWNFYLKVLQAGPLEYLGDTPYAYWHQRPGQQGAAGNSVIAGDDQHRRTDAMLRDEALRAHIDEHGIGLALYLTKFVDERVRATEDRLREEIERASFAQRVYRRARRILDR
ncbi:glycosyltransferase family 2 protein [Microbacterium sp. gxy059]|uniref:glycosyltransferase family 2 protein n=1 Tax=Microbacterium sp. gxy059 TaxID=2957199 RepID=UPI003D95EDB3